MLYYVEIKNRLILKCVHIYIYMYIYSKYLYIYLHDAVYWLFVCSYKILCQIVKLLKLVGTLYTEFYFVGKGKAVSDIFRASLDLFVSLGQRSLQANITYVLPLNHL